jgi:hypothetical protein
MAETKRKGSVSELIVLREAVERGYRAAIPYGEDGPWDLIVERNGRLERIQCKYTVSNGDVIVVKCTSTNNWHTKVYRSDEIEWIVVYDATTERCYFVPSSMLGDGRSMILLRLTEPKNGQRQRINWARDFTEW